MGQRIPLRAPPKRYYGLSVDNYFFIPSTNTSLLHQPKTSGDDNEDLQIVCGEEHGFSSLVEEVNKAYFAPNQSRNGLHCAECDVQITEKVMIKGSGKAKICNGGQGQCTWVLCPPCNKLLKKVAVTAVRSKRKRK
jgi:hypothetical protein